MRNDYGNRPRAKKAKGGRTGKQFGGPLARPVGGVGARPMGGVGARPMGGGVRAPLKGPANGLFISPPPNCLPIRPPLAFLVLGLFP